MANWLKDICKVLRTSKTYQIHGNLINFTDESKSKIRGKCAMGELGCKIGFKPMELYNLPEYQYETILTKYKVPLWLRKKNLPPIRGSIIHNNLYFGIEELSYTKSLAEWIYELNDTLELTFKQIADFLEVTFEDA